METKTPDELPHGADRRKKGRRSRFSGGSIKTRLVAAFTLLLLVPALLIGSLSYETARKSLQNEVKATVDQNVQMLNSIVNDTVDQKLKQVSSLSAVYNKSSPQATVSKELLAYASLHPEVQSIYIGTEQGTMTLAPVATLPKDYDPRKRPWYQNAVAAKGKAILTAPYETADGSGKMVVTIAQTLADGSGVIGLDLTLDKITNIVRTVSFGKKGYAFILDKDRKVVTHPTLVNGSAAAGKEFDPFYAAAEGRGTLGQGGDEVIDSFVTNELTGWKIVGAYPVKEINAATRPILQKTLIVAATAIAVAVLLIVGILHSILQPLRRIHSAVNRIGAGDLSDRIEQYPSNEFGDLAKGFNLMTDHLRTLIGEVSLNASQVASSAEQLTAGAEQTEKATEQIVTIIQEVAVGTDKQVLHVEESAAAIHQAAQAAQAASDHMGQISVTMNRAAGKSLEGKGTMETAVEQMGAVDASVLELAGALKRQGERSEEIGRIVEIMAEISAQTNLLALNAAIEAARAGEHGRGFTVVAGEVRKLADQSASSGSRIAGLVRDIQDDTRRVSESMENAQRKVAAGLKTVEEAGSRFEDIYSSVEQVTGEFSRMTGMADEIAQRMAHLSAAMATVQQLASETVGGTQSISAATQEQLASMEEIASSAASLGRMAEELQALTERFRL